MLERRFGLLTTFAVWGVAGFTWFISDGFLLCLLVTVRPQYQQFEFLSNSGKIILPLFAHFGVSAILKTKKRDAWMKEAPMLY